MKQIHQPEKASMNLFTLMLEENVCDFCHSSSLFLQQLKSDLQKSNFLVVAAKMRLGVPQGSILGPHSICLVYFSSACHLMFNNFHISAGLSQKLSDQQNTKVVPLLLIYLHITFLFSQLTKVWLT